MVKRFFDVIVSVTAFFLLLPLLILTGFLILIIDGRPIFYSQDRLGKDAVVFKFYKFRSMTNNPRRRLDQQIRGGDSEVTTIGQVIRRLKIDELPQIWNILKGDMSIVGPRPALPKYLETYSFEQRQRLNMRGGLTCLAQVHGSSFLSWDERIEYDLIYIETQTFWVDIKIILKTVLVVLLGEERFLKHPEKKGKVASDL